MTIHGLVSELGVGVTPVREAIRRLMAEGALEFRGNRRICLPILSSDLLDEVSFARKSIEPHLAYLATKRLQNKDIDQLYQIDEALNGAIASGDVRGYLQHNGQFHETLYAHSDARILMAISKSLWLRVGPSLRVVCGRFGTANLPDKHSEALAAMREGDAQGVADSIEADIEQGHEAIRRSLSIGNTRDVD